MWAKLIFGPLGCYPPAKLVKSRFCLAGRGFVRTFADPIRSRRTTDSMRVSEALDLGSIPSATTLKAIYGIVKGFFTFQGYA